MYELKTKINNASVEKFLKKVKSESTREDCFKIISLMKDVTKTEPKMWGTSIVGFGSYHYKYASGHEGDMCLTGFSPRAQNITIYLAAGFDMKEDLLGKLGKHKIGKACLYIKKLEDVDLKILKKIIEQSVKYISKKKWN